MILKPGADLTLAELQAHCRGRIASFKVPGHLRLIESLPKTASGKVRKSELRAAFRVESPVASA